MRHKTAVTCTTLLEKSLEPLLTRAGQLQRLEQKIHQLLPDDLDHHCHVMNLNNGVLTLSVASSAWAARLRFCTNTLLEQLTAGYGMRLQSIRVRILPQEPAQAEQISAKTPELSMQNATLLAQTARTIDHSGLQEALYRLAANVRGN